MVQTTPFLFIYIMYSFFYSRENYSDLDVGPVPEQEQCPCAGFPGYTERIQPHLERWIDKLRTYFSNLRNYGAFYKHSEKKRWGLEWTVVFRYYKTEKYGKQIEKFILENLPKKYDTDIQEIIFIPDSDEEEFDEFGDEGGYPFIPMI